jgi:hypothetical protein
MMITKSLLIIVLLISIVSFFSINDSFGHGLGFEVLPPVKLGDKQVALEVVSSQYSDSKSTERQITFSLFDTSSTVTIREVTYHITASKGNNFLFEDTFKSNNGIFAMVFNPTESGPVEIKEEMQGSFFESLLGTQKIVYKINGPAFKSGGLYYFEVEILTAESYSNKLEDPILYNVGLSIEDRTYYVIEDVNFGKQQISVITYYDKIENFQYNQKNNSIMFSMPFVWGIDNINQTSVVHEEIIISKTFGDLMVESLSAFVNGIKLPDHVITIDGFSEHTRIIHLVVNQKELFELYYNQENSDDMEFLIKPSSNNLPLETITGNGQFRIKLNWEPRDVKSGSNLILYFDIMDVFLKEKPVSVSYDLSVLHAGNEIFSTSGISTDSRDEHNVVEFFIPDSVNGPITVQFEYLNDNSLARVGLPLVVNRIYDVSNGNQVDISIPDWVRNNASWWSEGTITDNDFASGIEFMIKEGIIKVSSTVGQVSENAIIPDWVRNNANWWSERLVSDEEFANGLQYLIKNGIISV